MSEGGMCCGRGAALISNIDLSIGTRRGMMRAPISLKTLYLSYVGSITIHCITRYLTFTFPMHDTASTYRT